MSIGVSLVTVIFAKVLQSNTFLTESATLDKLSNGNIYLKSQNTYLFLPRYLSKWKKI